MSLYQLGRMYARNALFPAHRPFKTHQPLNWFGSSEGWNLQLVHNYGFSPRAFDRQNFEVQKDILRGIIDERGHVSDDQLQFTTATADATVWLTAMFARLGMRARPKQGSNLAVRTEVETEKVRTVTVDGSAQEIKNLLSL